LLVKCELEKDWPRFPQIKSRSMNKHRLVGIATLAFLSSTALVGANEQPDGWLRWNDDARGHPAITLSAATGIHVAMPEGMIAEAIALGKTKEEAVTAFLDRYAPGMCTDMADMLVAHDRLTVHVHMQKQDERFLPVRMFVMDDEAQDFVVSYAPDRPTHCIDPDTAPAS
jgi:hypothetical protein